MICNAIVPRLHVEGLLAMDFRDIKDYRVRERERERPCGERHYIFKQKTKGVQ